MSSVLKESSQASQWEPEMFHSDPLKARKMAERLSSLPAWGSHRFPRSVWVRIDGTALSLAAICQRHAVSNATPSNATLPWQDARGSSNVWEEIVQASAVQQIRWDPKTDILSEELPKYCYFPSFFGVRTGALGAVWVRY